MHNAAERCHIPWFCVNGAKAQTSPCPLLPLCFVCVFVCVFRAQAHQRSNSHTDLQLLMHPWQAESRGERQRQACNLVAESHHPHALGIQTPLLMCCKWRLGGIIFLLYNSICIVLKKIFRVYQPGIQHRKCRAIMCYWNGFGVTWHWFYKSMKFCWRYEATFFQKIFCVLMVVVESSV